MRFRLLIWVVAPLLVGAGAFLAHSIDWKRRWAEWTCTAPVAEIPTKIDLGERELGDTAVARLVVQNRGGGELLINQIRTNCSCTGLEQEENGRYKHIEILHLGPKERSELVVRLSVRGRIGTPMGTTILMRTNDPSLPEARVEIVVTKIKGGVSTVPTVVLLGTVPVGNEARQIIDVYDKSGQNRSVSRVVSSNPDRIRARLLPPESGEPNSSENNSMGPPVARIEVTAGTTDPGPIEGQIAIHLADDNRPPTVVPVSGRAAEVAEASPREIVLPRSSKSGDVYFADCLCRNPFGEPLTLTLESAPPGLSVRISFAENNPSVKLVRIGWDPHLSRPGRTSVRFRARVEVRDTLLEIPVECHGSEIK